MTADAPAIQARKLLRSAGLTVLDVRCSEHQPALGGEERVASLEIVLPMTGLFVREAHPVQGRRHVTAEIGDPTRVLFFRAGERHRVRHPLGGADRSLVIAMDVAATQALRGDPASLPPGRHVPARAHLHARRLGAALAAGRLDPLSGADLTIALLDAIIPSAAGTAAGTAVHEDRPSRRGGRALADDVRLVLASRVGDRLALADLARLVASSPFHLARVFRAATGLSIHAYRTQLRVRGVLARIEAGDRDLARVALDHGFVDQSHMTNVVRREIGRPPSTLRRPATARELREMGTILQV